MIIEDIMLILSPAVGYAMGRYIHKPRYKNHSVVSHLRFGFTLDGRLTGEEIPLGVDPREAASERSHRTGKKYGAQRI